MFKVPYSSTKSNRKSRRKWKKRSNAKLFLFLIGSFLFFGVSFLFFNEISTVNPANSWSEVNANKQSKILFPRDESPHENKMEWWYYNGLLEDEDSRKYSFHFTIFQLNGLLKQMVSHVSLTDHQTNQHYTVQQSSGGTFSKPEAHGYNFAFDDWLMVGGMDNDHLRVSTEHFGFNLRLKSVKEPVLHGLDGKLELDTYGSSYYYSRTRLLVTGMLKLGDSSKYIEGNSWFDHQWGDFSTTLLKWNWFSLQLGQSKEIMLYQLTDQVGMPVLSTGTFIDHDWKTVLDGSEFSLKPQKKWTSDETGIEFPVSWELRIPHLGMDLTINSLTKDSEFDARTTTYNVYWEGAVSVKGTHRGHGFMEMAGYQAKSQKAKK